MAIAESLDCKIYASNEKAKTLRLLKDPVIEKRLTRWKLFHKSVKPKLLKSVQKELNKKDKWKNFDVSVLPHLRGFMLLKWESAETRLTC